MLEGLLGLFAASVLVSQTAMDVFAGLLVLSMLWVGFRWREQKSSHTLFVRTGWDWMFVIWFIWVFLGLALNGFEGEKWIITLLNFKWILVFYVVLAALVYVRPKEKIVIWVSGFFAFCSLYAIAVWFFGEDPLRPGSALETLPDGTFRTGGFLAQPIVFAHVYQIPLCVLFGLWLTKFHWREKGHVWVLSSVGLGFLAILLSFSRGAWISCGAAVLFMTALFSLRMAFLLLGALAAGFFSLYTFWSHFHDRIQYALKGGDLERIWIWKANWQMFKDHPVWGLGYQENIEALHEYYKKVEAPQEFLIAHAHNQYLHMLAGTGAVGLGIYLLIIGYFFILAIRVWRSISSREVFAKGLSLGLIGAQVAFMVGGLTEANLEHSKTKYALLWVWALTVWLAYENRILREKL
jgi:O-antigen ligase